MRVFFAGLVLGLLLAFSRAQAANEVVTVPLVLGDYYAWAYTEAIEDHAAIYGWSTASVERARLGHSGLQRG